MNSQRKIYGRAALLMAGIALASAVLTHFTGTVDTTRRGKTVVTTVYPLYVAAQNVLGDIPGITLVNLTGSATGCLHDYQLSPANRITLGSADLLLLNGAGAESFLEDVLPTLSATAVDTSAGLPLLDGDGHDHDHDHAHSHATEEDHDEGHAHADNEHVWVSPTRYAAQVQAITCVPWIRPMPPHTPPTALPTAHRCWPLPMNCSSWPPHWTAAPASPFTNRWPIRQMTWGCTRQSP